MIVSSGNRQTLMLAAGEVLTVAASTAGSGSVVMLGKSVGGEPQGVTPVAAGQSITFGRYSETTRFEVVCDGGFLTYMTGVAAPATQADLAKLASITASADQIDEAVALSTAVLFADLPSPVEGMRRAVIDSMVDTWGAIITGGGSSHVLAYYNGTNWTVAAK
jgi:hypothetical protein